MKRIISIILLVLVFSACIVSCAESDNEGSAMTGAQQSEPNESANSTPDNTESGDISDNPDNPTSGSSAPEFESKEYTAPANVIYNTAQGEHYAHTWTAEASLPTFSYAAELYPLYEAKTDPCELETLVGEHKGDSETWFYVAFSVNSYSRSEGTQGWDRCATDEEMVEESRTAAEYLIGLGFIPDFDHIWSYTQYVNGKHDYPTWYNVVGYITADMITEIESNAKDDIYMHFTVYHLPENDKLTEFMSAEEHKDLIAMTNASFVAANHSDYSKRPPYTQLYSDRLENTIYNTLETVKSEKYEYSYFSVSDESLCFANDRLGTEEEKGSLELLLEEYKGDGETWFYVAVDVNALSRKMGAPPDNDERAFEALQASHELTALGMIENKDHPWNYSRFLDGTKEDEPAGFMITGYMTADMILAIESETYQFNILHLPEDEYLEEAFGEYDFGDVTKYKR